MAQPKNKKRRSRKRARSGPGGPPAPSGSTGPATGDRPTTTKAERSRKARDARSAAPGPPSLKADRGEAPQPIWAPLPITEGLILVGLIGAVAGLATQSTGLLLGGLGLLVASSLELALREHLAGYRSHSSLIAAVVAMASAAGLGVALNAADVGLPQWPLLLVAALVFAGMFRLMRETFKRRSGGLSFRV
ncbi:hypothetical protein [Patulibacter sp.]|uniref:hypothetical protein n=1 Tax=Patulibacter sp. TaxID=1912859 RepID=UPI0027232488|nr:hypothetical protein [Patulibacter sp.]MDO9408706.1 hypothetical protein [Patulibacter sp.]